MSSVSQINYLDVALTAEAQRISPRLCVYKLVYYLIASRSQRLIEIAPEIVARYNLIERVISLDSARLELGNFARLRIHHGFDAFLTDEQILSLQQDRASQAQEFYQAMQEIAADSRARQSTNKA